MQIVMDGAGDIPEGMAEALEIHIVPINIMFGQEEYLSGVTMDHAAFYEKTKTVDDSNFPKTSQPTPYQFEQVYRSLLARGASEILTITVSEKLSGTYASAVSAARALTGQATFHLFDSKAGSGVQGFMAVEAARLARAGATSERILGRLAQMREQFSLYFLIDSLEYAVRGGRVSSLRSTVASLLKIKPLMTVAEGLIVEAGRVRTSRRALTTMIDRVQAEVGGRPVTLAAVHGNRPEAGRALLEEARSCFQVVDAYLMDLAISVAVNLGPGALGLIAIPVEE
jgi:DegV family protein with EDD domain